jgi:hypothetical protein
MYISTLTYMFLFSKSRCLPACLPALYLPAAAANVGLWGGLTAGGLAAVALLQVVGDLLGETFASSKRPPLHGSATCVEFYDWACFRCQLSKQTSVYVLLVCQQLLPLTSSPPPPLLLLLLLLLLQSAVQASC